MGNTYSYLPSGKDHGIHELVKEVATINEQVSYPSISVLDNELSIVYQRTGYISPAGFKVLLNEL